MAQMKPILFNTEMVKAILDGRKTVTRRIANINTDITCNDGATDHDYVLDNFAGRVPTGFVCRKCGFGVAPPHSRVPCGGSLFRPRYWPGDILYVRETWAKLCYVDPDGYTHFDKPMLYYAADGTPDIVLVDEDGFELDNQRIRWKPSIHMPKEAARIFLRVTDVRVERLQDITIEQAIREGIVRMFDHMPDAEYDAWSARTCPGKKKEDHGWNNYLWHGNFGSYGMGNKMSDAWPYQRSGYEEARLSFSSLWNLTVPLKDWAINGWDANPWVWVIEFEQISKEEST